MAEYNNTSKLQKTQGETFLNGIIEFFISGIATSFELMIRKNFGERYFTFPKFLVGLITLGFFVAISTTSYNLADFSIFYSQRNNLYFNPAQGDIYPNFSRYLFIAYFIAYIFLGMTELRQAFVRSRNGDPWHSFFNGESRVPALDRMTERLGLKRMLGQHIISNHIVQLYIEPLFFLSLGLGLALILPPFGVWFMIGSFIVFVRGQFIYGRLKEHVLDMNDSRIESKSMVTAFKGGATPQETSGFTTLAIRPSGLQIPVDTQQAIREMYEQNPALAKLAGLNQTPETVETKPNPTEEQATAENTETKRTIHVKVPKPTKNIDVNSNFPDLSK